MQFSLLNLNTVLLIMCILSSVSPDTTNIIRIFGGTLTKITCSATQPGFRLTKQDIEYGPRDYSELPALFDIEARVSPTGNNITLYINGTNHSNNVNVTCSDFSGIAFGRIETIFSFVLEFIRTLLPPINVRHNLDVSGRQFELTWEPPAVLEAECINCTTAQNIRIDPRIRHYQIYIHSTVTDEPPDPEVFISITVTFTLNLINVSCNFSYQVAAVNTAGLGEKSVRKNVDWCTSVTSQIQVSTSGPVGDEVRDKRIRFLSDWAISSTTVAVFLAIVLCAILLTCSLTKMYYVGKNMHLKNTSKKEIEMQQNVVYGINLANLSSNPSRNN